MSGLDFGEDGIIATGARTACAPTVEDVYVLLASGKFDLADEKRAQAEMDELLVGAFGREAVRREHRLGAGDIPDFLVAGGIVIEAKGPRHQARAVLRQLERYAAYLQVTSLILVTARAMAGPPRVGGKRLWSLNMGRAWL